MLHFMVTVSIWLCLVDPINDIISHAPDDIKNFYFQLKKNNSREMLPMCQDKFFYTLLS